MKAGPSPSEHFDLCDAALLASFAVVAALGTCNRVLLVNDGAFLLSVGWLGNPWDLYFHQFDGRAVALALSYGPAWLVRRAFDPSADTYITVAHALYFAVPLGLWLAIRTLEPARIFSRLYLAAILVLAYFPSEIVVGAGLWTIWASLIAGPARPRWQIILLTLGFAVALAFTHAALAAMTVLYLIVGWVLTLAGRPFPRPTLEAAAVMAALLMVGYALTSHFLPPTNPTIAATIANAGNDYVDPNWLIATLMAFPMLPIAWLLLLSPGASSINRRWRMPSFALAVVSALGLWFAANATSLYTYLFARYTVAEALALALALALAMPASEWLVRARWPLIGCAAITGVAALSYNVDIMRYGRFVDWHLMPGVFAVDERNQMAWPPLKGRSMFDRRFYFKWTAGSDYVRDVVVPDYERYRQALAFYSFFRSDRQSVLFHRITRGHWYPFHCASIDNIRPRDEPDRRFLDLLAENYCIR